MILGIVLAKRYWWCNKIREFKCVAKHEPRVKLDVFCALSRLRRVVFRLWGLVRKLKWWVYEGEVMQRRRGEMLITTIIAYGKMKCPTIGNVHDASKGAITQDDQTMSRSIEGQSQNK